jgi:hypothetical protein
VGIPFVWNFPNQNGGSNVRMNPVTLRTAAAPNGVVLSSDLLMFNFANVTGSILPQNVNGVATNGVLIMPLGGIQSGGGNPTLNGRVFGGMGNQQFVSHTTVQAPVTTGKLINTATVSGSNFSTVSATDTITITSNFPFNPASLVAAQSPPQGQPPGAAGTMQTNVSAAAPAQAADASNGAPITPLVSASAGGSGAGRTHAHRYVRAAKTLHRGAPSGLGAAVRSPHHQQPRVHQPKAATAATNRLHIGQTPIRKKPPWGQTRGSALRI